VSCGLFLAGTVHSSRTRDPFWVLQLECVTCCDRRMLAWAGSRRMCLGFPPCDFGCTRHVAGNGGVPQSKFCGIQISGCMKGGRLGSDSSAGDRQLVWGFSSSACNCADDDYAGCRDMLGTLAAHQRTFFLARTSRRYQGARISTLICHRLQPAVPGAPSELVAPIANFHPSHPPGPGNAAPPAHSLQMTPSPVVRVPLVRARNNRVL